MPDLTRREPLISCGRFRAGSRAAPVDWLHRQPGDVQSLSSEPPARRSIARGRANQLRDTRRRAGCREPLDPAICSARYPDQRRIGIIIPDLGSRYGAVLRQFTAELDPLLSTGTQGLLDIGGGTR